MATKQTTPTKTKKVTKAQIVTEVEKPVNKPKIELVTSLNLKRAFVSNGVRASFFLSEEEYRDLNLLGIKLGVTWDEVVRGLIAQHLASTDQLSGVKYFIPALQ